MAGLIGPFLFAALRGSDLTVCQRTPQSRQIRSLVSLERTLVPGKGFVNKSLDGWRSQLRLSANCRSRLDAFLSE